MDDSKAQPVDAAEIKLPDAEESLVMRKLLVSMHTNGCFVVLFYHTLYKVVPKTSLKQRNYLFTVGQLAYP